MSDDITPEMAEAGTRILHDSGITEHPMDADALVVSDIYRAMRRLEEQEVSEVIDFDEVMENLSLVADIERGRQRRKTLADRLLEAIEEADHHLSGGDTDRAREVLGIAMEEQP